MLAIIWMSPLLIPVPEGDLYFDPQHSGTQNIYMFRSLHDPITGTSIGNPRSHLKEITAWIDASNVYGSDEGRGPLVKNVFRRKIKNL